jgi:hypothetical protein
VAPKKPTSGRRPAQRKSTAKPAASATAKSEPVVLDPPAKRTTAAQAKKPETVDAKAVDVTPKQDEKPQEAKATASSETVKTDKPAPADSADAKASEKATPPKPTPPVEPKAEKSTPVKEPRRSVGIGGFVTLLAGGTIAAGIGYYAGTLNVVTAPDQSGEILRMQETSATQIAGLQQEIADLKAQLAAIQPADTSSLEADYSALKSAYEETTAKLSDRLSAAETRLDQTLADLAAARDSISGSLEGTGAELSDAANVALARYAAELKAMKEQLAAQLEANSALSRKIDEVAVQATNKLSEAQQKITEATDAAVDTVRQADFSVAIARLREAVETGKSYAAVLGDIAKETDVDIPESLSKPAGTGVVPLLQLQQVFPEAARQGLKASIKASAGEGMGDRLTAFLKAQIGARSLEEKEGNDPDAILSRAEGALGRGELQNAVDLVRQLPSEGVEAMSGWLTRAEERLAVSDALDVFTKSIDPAK